MPADAKPNILVIWGDDIGPTARPTSSFTIDQAVEKLEAALTAGR